MFEGGYTKRILRINLTNKRSITETLGEEVLKDFIGGRGLAGYLFYKETTPGIDPFSPSSKIAILTGPLQGTPTPYTPKLVIANKSPLSGSYSRSVCGGGSFAPELKYAGYDGIIIEGKAEAPVYIFIDDQEVRIRDARKHWGKSTSQTEDAIRAELNDLSVKILPIGPAGENLVRFSGVIPESRAAGRGGSGAVFGAKNLKAIAVRGTGTVRVARPDIYREILAEAHIAIKADPQSQVRIDYGTTGTVAAAYRAGTLPIMNYSRATLKGIEDLFAEIVKEKVTVHNESCFGCPLPCGKTAIIKSGPYRGTVIQGPQFETIGLLGSNCGILDIHSVTRANYLCNELGLDTISTGNVIAFAIECFQKGLLSKQEADHMELRFGDPEVVLELIEKIASREGIGDWLAEGTKRLSDRIGKGAERFAMHSKGQGFASFDPRALVGMGLVYATATPGANHSYGPTLVSEVADLKDPLTHKGKGKMVRTIQNNYCLQDSMIFCSFSRYGFDNERRFTFLDAVTGHYYNEEQRVLIADRIYTLERLFNLREGLTKSDDTLPWRSLHEPIPDGPAKGNIVPLEPMKSDYYRERGWNQDGIPTRETIDRLGLGDLVGKIEL